MDAINPGGAVVVPFTNTIRLHNVPDAKVAAVQNAEFVRVVDGNGYFDNTLLSRLRRVADVSVLAPEVAVALTSDVVIRLSDFTTYPPQPAGLTLPATAASITTDASYFGLNRFSRRGSEWVLYADDAGTSMLTGSPLPFSDYVNASTFSSTPASVLPGQDFLVSVSRGTSWTNTAFTTRSLPDQVRLFPMDAYYTGGLLGISRIDSFMDSRPRVNYTGAATYEFQSARPTSGAVDYTEIKDYGGPYMEATWTPAVATPVLTRYDGITKPAYGRNPGVSLRARDPGGDPLVFTTANIATQAKEVDVLLNPSTPDWLSRGVAPGDHIVCTVMHDYDVAGTPFTGAVSAITLSVGWQGWGRVSEIDPALPHVARVVGMDIHRLHTVGVILADNTLGGFSLDVAFPGQFGLTTKVVAAAPLAASTVPDGVEATLTIQIPDAPGTGYQTTHPGILPTTVTVLRSDTATTYTEGGAGAFGAVALELLSGTVDYVTGLITLVFDPAAIPPIGATFDVAYSYYTQDMYRAYWTAYRGEREMVTPEGVVVTSYDELAFAPSYLLHGVSTVVGHSMPSGYKTTPTAGGVDFLPGFHDSASIANVPFSVATNPHVGVWLRLDTNFYSTVTSLGGPAAELSYGAEVTSLTAVTGGASAPPQNLYSVARLQDAFAADVRAAVNESIVRTAVSLPYIEGALRVSNVSDTTTFAVDTTTSVLENSKGHSGFLLPHPMGSMWQLGTIPAPSQVAEWIANLSLTNQLVEVYDSVTATTDPVGIEVSGIPGSTPFPEAFTGTLNVDNNQIHLGGLTDVYIKAVSETPDTAGPITCTPASLLDTAKVLVQGADGSVSATSEFLSPTLLAYLTTAFDLGAATKALDNLALVIVNPSALTPAAPRVLNNVIGGVRIDWTFSDTVANLRWRLIRVSSTSLVDPRIVLQQGTDLNTVSGSAQVTSASGFTFTEDPTVVPIYLRVDAGDDTGDYLIISKGASSLTLETPLNATTSAVAFRVCQRPGGGVQLPLVRQTRVSLSGSAEGVDVPYRHPVDIVSSSFGGLNNDPISDTSSHGTGLGILSVNGGGTACTFATANVVSFITLGVQVNDVLRLDGQDDPLRYFYVTAVSANTLTLDRLEPTVTSAITGQSFTLGHPSLGTATLRFLDPTFISTDQSTVLTSTIDGVDYRFRPSPAESALLYRSPVSTSGILVDAFGGLNKVLKSSSVDFFKHGVAAGDTVQILSRVIYSQGLSSSTGYTLAGKSLVIAVAGVYTTVVFTGTNPLTLDDIVSDINAVMQDKLLASVVETAHATTWKISIASRNAVEIVDAGSTNILTTLGFTVASDRKNTLPSTMVASFTVDSVSYAAGFASITLTATTTATIDDEVFVRILRASEQRLYPADLVQDATGLWAGTIRVTSMDPLSVVALTEGAAMTVTGHTSLGYDLTVENENYSYSMGEQCALRVTSIMVGPSAEDLSVAYVLPSARVTVEYERSQQVQDVQSYMLNPEVRVVNHNPLVRHFLPAYPLISIVYSGNQSAAQVRTAVSDFLQTLYPNKPLEVFDLAAVLAKLNIQYVTFPQEVAAITHDSARLVRVVRARDILVLGKRYHLMGDTSNVAVNRVG